MLFCVWKYGKTARKRGIRKLSKLPCTLSLLYCTNHIRYKVYIEFSCRCRVDNWAYIVLVYRCLSPPLAWLPDSAIIWGGEAQNVIGLKRCDGWVGDPSILTLSHAYKHVEGGGGDINISPGIRKCWNSTSKRFQIKGQGSLKLGLTFGFKCPFYCILCWHIFIKFCLHPSLMLCFLQNPIIMYKLQRSIGRIAKFTERLLNLLLVYF